MTEKQIDLSTADRGDKTKEELEAELTPEALALVAQMEERTLTEFKRNAKAERRFYRKNRTAWDRMNRKARVASVVRGTEKILNLISGVGFVTDEQVKQEIPV